MADDTRGLSRRQLLQGSVGAVGAAIVAPGLGGANRVSSALRRADAASTTTTVGSAGTSSPGAPTALSVDDLPAPIGLSPDDISFAWHVTDDSRGALQSAYRIVVTRFDPSTNSPGGPVVWDTGRHHSPHQAFVPYRGPRLAADRPYSWTVQTWSRDGVAGPLAPPAVFETGLRTADWQARWITRPADASVEPDQHTYLRRTFTLPPTPVTRARIYVSADQRYELSVNGRRAGKGEAYSYPDTQYYETLDVTALLEPGTTNAIGILANWQAAAKGHPAGTSGVIAQLSVLLADGSRQVVVTDGTWRVRRGAWLPGTQRDLEGDVVDYTENIDG